MLQASKTTLDLMNAVLPVVTFLLGIAVSQLEKWRALRRRVRNIKTMLRQELVEDYRLLNAVVARKDQRVGNPQVAAMMASSISSTIYDSYLSKLDELSPKDLDAVYDAYLAIKFLCRSADDFLKALQDKIQSESKFKALGAIVVVLADAALGKTKHALVRLATDRSVMATHEGQRGSAFDSLSEIEKSIHE